MEQPIEAGILDTLKSLFDRVFKDILSGFDEGGYSKKSEETLDLSKAKNAPRDSKVREVVESIDPEKRQGMSQIYTNKENKKANDYEIKYYDLSNAKGYENYMYAEIYNAKTGEYITSIYGLKTDFQKQIKKEIQKLMDAEKKNQPQDDASASTKVLKLNLKKITASTYVDYQLTDLSSNYPLTLVKDDIPTILSLDELYEDTQEGDNLISVEVTDDEFNIRTIESEINSNSEHVLQQFLNSTLDIYRFVYAYHYMHPQDTYVEQIMLISKDIIDQIASDLAKENMFVHFNPPLIYETTEKYDMAYEGLPQWIEEYLQVYNDVICLILSYDAQDTYDMFMRQLNFITTNR